MADVEVDGAEAGERDRVGGVGKCERERELGRRASRGNGQEARIERTVAAMPWPSRPSPAEDAVGLAVRDERGRHAEHLDAGDVGPLALPR